MIARNGTVFFEAFHQVGWKETIISGWCWRILQNVVSTRRNCRASITKMYTSRDHRCVGSGLAIHSKDASGQPDEQGGRVYSLRTDQKRSLQELERVETNDYSTQIHRGGDNVWIGRGELSRGGCFSNDDPKLNRRLRKSFSGDKPRFQRELSLLVRAKVGEVLKHYRCRWWADRSTFDWC